MAFVQNYEELRKYKYTYANYIPGDYERIGDISSAKAKSHVKVPHDSNKAQPPHRCEHSKGFLCSGHTDIQQPPGVR